MKIKVYLSDEGYGHVVRQEAIIKELFKLRNDLDITIQTQEKIDVVKEKFGDSVTYVEKFNNIKTTKTLTGYLDLEETKRCFENYPKIFEKVVEEECDNFDYDFVISDTVPEAHEVARLNNVPSFGIFHFDWGWFCSRVYPELTETINLFEKCYSSSTKIYMPPFSPPDITTKYSKNLVNVPCIINEFNNVKIPSTKKTNVLIMDNGTSTLSEIILHNFPNFLSLSDYHFFMSDKLAPPQAGTSGNITLVSGLKNVHSLIPKVDVIVARAGYNTITESLITGVPLLLVNEGDNPEVNFNVKEVCNKGLSFSISTDEYRNEFVVMFEDFMKNHYNNVKENLLVLANKGKRPIIKSGAKVIAKHILKEI